MGDSDYAEHRRGQLASYARARDAGVDCWLEVLPPNAPRPCPVADAQAGVRYGHNDVPMLPLPGCQRKLGCACCIVVGMPDAAPMTPAQSTQLDRDYEAALAKLSPRQAKAVRAGLAGILRGFGIKS